MVTRTVGEVTGWRSRLGTESGPAGPGGTTRGPGSERGVPRPAPERALGADSLSPWSSGGCATTSTGDPWPPPSNDSASGRGGPVSTSVPGVGDVSVALAEIVGPRRPGLRRGQRPHGPGRGGRGRRRPQPGAGHHPVRRGPPTTRSRSTWPSVVSSSCTWSDPAVVLARMAAAVRPGGWVVAQEPITSAGRINGEPVLHALGPSSRHRRDCCRPWPETPDWSPWTPGPRPRPVPDPGPVADYLRLLTEVDPGDDPVVLPPLVTVVAQAPPA